MGGAHAGLCCVISSESLSEAAEKALDSSLAALGYGHDADAAFRRARRP